MLGARVPVNALRDALARTGPAAVAIWAHSPATADGDQISAADGARPRPAIVAACGPGWIDQARTSRDGALSAGRKFAGSAAGGRFGPGVRPAIKSEK